MPTTTTVDHFSRQAAAYARYRPRYPRALFAHLADLAPSRSLAWDAGTGNGQAAVGLAEFFDHVDAVDASAKQIELAAPHPRVTYRVASAYDSGLPAESVDLATVAQAVHWFDAPAYFSEVRRVLRPGGIAALWGYRLAHISPAIDPIMHKYYSEIVGPYWAPNVRHVIEGCRDIPFPFDELPAPAGLFASAEWTLADAFGFLSSWSAAQAFMAARGYDPLSEIHDDLTRCWGPAETVRRAEWPLYLRVGRK